MALTTAEIDALRFHLGYGNINVGALPYTPDGFYELFHTTIGPNLSSGAETTATTPVTGAGPATITPTSMTGIDVHTRLVVDVGTDAETVIVRSVTPTTFTATFAKAHPASGYPVAVESGTTRLRALLASAEAAYSTLRSSQVTQTAGIKQLGQGEIEWFEGAAVYRDTLTHYLGIVELISSLVRVPNMRSSRRRAATRLETY